MLYSLYYYIGYIDYSYSSRLYTIHSTLASTSACVYNVRVDITGSPSYGRHHIKACMGNLKIVAKTYWNAINRSFSSTYLCSGDFSCFWGVCGRFSCDLRCSAKNDFTGKLSRMNYFIAFQYILGTIKNFPYIPLYDVSHSLGYLCLTSTISVPQF